MKDWWLYAMFLPAESRVSEVTRLWCEEAEDWWVSGGCWWSRQEWWWLEDSVELSQTSAGVQISCWWLRRVTDWWWLWCLLWYKRLQLWSVGREVWSQVHHGELGGVPQFVAEESVSLHSQHIQVDISALQQSETSVILFQPIRSYYYSVSTNKRSV